MAGRDVTLRLNLDLSGGKGVQETLRGIREQTQKAIPVLQSFRNMLNAGPGARLAQQHLSMASMRAEVRRAEAGAGARAFESPAGQKTLRQIQATEGETQVNVLRQILAQLKAQTDYERSTGGRQALGRQQTLHDQIEAMTLRREVDQLKAQAAHEATPAGQQHLDEMFRLNRQRQELADAQQLRPDVLRRRVAEENRAEQARERFDKALAAERRRQWRPATVFGRAAKSLGAGPEKGFLGGSLGSVFGKAGEEFGALAGAVGKVVGPIGLVTGSMAALSFAAIRTARSMAEAARLSDPAMFKRYERAQLDRAAATGRLFEPVLYGMTRFEETIGDFLNTIIPRRDEMQGAFQAMNQGIGSLRLALQEVAGPLQTFIKTGLQAFAMAIRATAEAVRGAVGIIRGAARTALSLPGGRAAIPLLVGLGFGSNNGLQSARGLAPGATSFGGQDEVARRIYASAYASGRSPGGQKSAIQLTSENIANIWNWLNRINPERLMQQIPPGALDRAGRQAQAEGNKDAATVLAVLEAVRRGMMGH